mmetsp:Transcript_11983/g.16251  ORF Transcript_11983/g.16251 Transcript_11983/m.16251 type:complete len:349 (-) Transcript_11983:118-1164(-)
MLGDTACTAVAVIEAHREIRCIVGQSEGSNQSISVTVKEVVGVQSLNRISFVYRKAGCLSQESENFDAAVTDDDGSCRVLGCTQQEASNYNPRANVNDGSCIREPETVTMKVRLDFSIYLTNTTEYDRLFILDISAQLTIDPNRIVILEVLEGSTIFVFQILDTPESRAQDVALRLENMVLNNEWSMSVFSLLQLKWEDSPSGTVDTKQDEPRVSMWSIIGLTIGLPVLLLWAVFWRRSLLLCARRCCGTENEEEIERQMMMEGGQVKTRFGTSAGQYQSVGSQPGGFAPTYASVNRTGSATSQPPSKPTGSGVNKSGGNVNKSGGSVSTSGESVNVPLRITGSQEEP